MRLLRLIEAAVQAEILRVSAQAQRSAMRVAWAAVALVFLAGALATVHVAVIAWMVQHMSLVQAALIVALVDIIVAGILVAIAARSRPGRAEIEALALRRQVWAGLERDLAFVSIATTVFDMFWRKK